MSIILPRFVPVTLHLNGFAAICNLILPSGSHFLQHNISPLHVAAKWGKSNLVALLLERGAHIEAKTRDGLTPLHCAARSGHEQVVDMMLERGAPISCKTKVWILPLLPFRVCFFS